MRTTTARSPPTSSSRFTAGKRRAIPAGAGSAGFRLWCGTSTAVPNPAPAMLFEQIATGGCQSYLVGCEATCAAVLIDPEIRQLDRYHAHAARDGLRIRYVIDTHTHADHFSAAHHFGRTAGIPVVMHRDSPAPFADMRLDDGDILAVGNLRLTAMHTPGAHARLDVPAARGPDLHRRHAADRRHRADRSADRRSRGAVRQPVQRPPQARSGAQDLPGARLQGPGLEHARPRARRESAAQGRGPRGLLQDDARAQPVGAHAHHRGAAHQHERRQDRRAAPGRGRRKDALHVARRAARPRRAEGTADRARRAGEGCLPGRSRAGRAPSAARTARAARQRGAARSDAADPHRLRVRQGLDARGGDAARPRLSARRRARRRHEGLARRGLPSRKNDLQTPQNSSTGSTSIDQRTRRASGSASISGNQAASSRCSGAWLAARARSCAR